MGPRTARVDDTLGNALVVKVGNFFAKNEIFEQCGPARSRFERILVMCNEHALVCRQQRAAGSRLLVQLTAGTGCAGLLVPQGGWLGPRHSLSPTDYEEPQLQSANRGGTHAPNEAGALRGLFVR
jgi:hypothetical protein